jgi:hypothetical protein
MENNNPYIPYIETFTNSHEFSYLAKYFYKHKCYTMFPAGTLQYKQFWDDVTDKCINGFTNSSGISITGQYFFYLNFVQIASTDDEDNRKKNLFPKFVDLDYEYFWMTHFCKKNQLSLCAVKGRRQGWSYKAAAICTHEYTFYRESSCVIGAYLSDFSQLTMNMVLSNCNFLNRYTEFKKQRNPDTKEIIMSRYQVDVGGTKIWKGYHSKIETITYRNNEFAAVGKSSTWLILDESGVFSNIIEAYGMSEPLIKDGNIYTGVCLMFGSAGNMEAGSQYFKDIFTAPNKYNMLEFENPKAPGNKIGFFSTAAKGRWGVCRDPKSQWYKKPMVDKDGNSNIEAAKEDILWEREKKKKGGDIKAYHNFVTQYPIDWEEAFLITTRSPFPLHLIQERLAELETKQSITDAIWNADLVIQNDNIEFKLSKKEPITVFPIRDKTSVNLDGCIEIYEQPYDDKPAYGIYIAGIDPYDDDQADNSDSLGSCIIMNTLTNRIVAQYTARPQTAKEYYENVRRLLIYYNAIANYENNKKGLFGYFENKNCLYLLADTPKILKDSQLLKTDYTTGNNAKGTPATKEVNKYGRELYKSYLYEQAFNKEDGITNTHTIVSKTILKETELWNIDGNFDRVSAMMMLMILKEDRFKLVVSKEEERAESQDEFFERNWQENKNSYSGTDLMYYNTDNSK